MSIPSSIGRFALYGLAIGTAIGFMGSHSACENRTFEGGRYFMANLVVGLFFGIVGGGVGAAIAAIRRKG